MGSARHTPQKSLTGSLGRSRGWRRATPRVLGARGSMDGGGLPSSGPWPGRGGEALVVNNFEQSPLVRPVTFRDCIGGFLINSQSHVTDGGTRRRAAFRDEGSASRP